MKIFKVGESQKAACEICQSFENATFKLRDVPFSDGKGIVKNVLVGVCDKCDSVTVLPHQSTPAVKKQYEAKRKPVEGRLPAHLIDIFYLKSDLAIGKAEKRLSLKGRQIYDELDLLKSLAHIENTTDLLKSIILKINDDVLIKRKPKSIENLRNIMAAVA